MNQRPLGDSPLQRRLDQAKLFIKMSVWGVEGGERERGVLRSSIDKPLSKHARNKGEDTRNMSINPGTKKQGESTTFRDYVKL